MLPSFCLADAFTVERVIDGDTLKLTNGERVRLIGIDCPESRINYKAKRDAKRTGKDVVTITKMGQEATEFVKRLIKPGDEVRLEFDVGEKDRYGRLLAYVYHQYTIPLGTAIGLEPIEKIMYFKDKSHVETFVNAYMVYSGYASPMTIPPNVKYADLFKELYEEARENN